MIDTTSHRPTWTEIDLDNLAFNFHSVKRFVGENIKYMAVVKADAYGHGSIECARRLEAEGIDWFGVALPEEGIELRQAGIRKLILCLGSFWSGQEHSILNYDLTPVIYQMENAELLDRAAKERGGVANIHVKIDTGMGRIGVRYDAVIEFAERLGKLKNLRLEGLMTHFASADDLSENDFTSLQIERFNHAVKTFEEKGFRPVYRDLANSPGAIVHPDSRQTMVRLGGVLYGLGGDVLPKAAEKPELKPVLSLHSRIAHIKEVPEGETLGYSRTFRTERDSTIATVPIGYDDGYSRTLSNLARAIVGGAYVPVVGRVSMDWILLDISEIPNINVGDKVVLIGEKDGLVITAEELAAKTGTISYEITCGINRRVTRHFTPGK
jgi:alanine racemase